MFEGFEERVFDAGEVEIFARIGGDPDAPPLLLLHGYPQTSAIWHLIAPQFAKDHHVICPDLRGYGRSGKPPSVADHGTYSKRAMATDMVRVMEQLGHDRFHVGAHDRGARVTHRMAVDHPDRVIAASLHDIAPTREMYAGTNMLFATAYWHWFFLIQPAPLPETIIGKDPDAYWRGKVFNMTKGNDVFHPDALAEYLMAHRDPETIRGNCEDYRAAATIDISHDDADGDALCPVPLQVLWGKKGTIERAFDALALWRTRAMSVEGQAVDTYHYVPEEAPDEVAALMRDFFARHPA
ncbi:MAG: alpha/beta hydrolase [Rhodobacteraceae bacterium]|nr:alpha/beta hydrolase [Paracoccaceae bacterium]